MRFFRGMAGLLAGTGLCITGAQAMVGCGDDFSGCEAARTCKAGAPGASAEAGMGSSDETAGSSGKAGTSSTSQGGGKGGSSSSNGSSGDGGDGGEAVDTSPHQGGASGAGDEGGTGSGVDTNPPHVVSTSPATDDKGVTHDAKIRITFSESMNEDAVANAFHSDDLPSYEVSWEDHDRVLVLDPGGKLEYGAVDAPDQVGKTYTYTLGGTATDVAGNPIGADTVVSFRTLRDVRHTLTVQSGYARTFVLPGLLYYKSACSSPSDELLAGDLESDKGQGFAFAFDLSTVPAGIVEWTSGTLFGEVLPTSTLDPYMSLGDLLAGREIVSSLDELVSGTAAASEVIAHSVNDKVFKLDVLASIKSDYEHRVDQNNLSSTRVQFETVTNGDGISDEVSVSCASLSLKLEYTAP
jgi:hypothetical protein